jgi:hypothetical protein
VRRATALLLVLTAGCSAPGMKSPSIADSGEAHLRSLERIAGVDESVELPDSVLYLRLSPPGRPRCAQLAIFPFEGEGVRAFTSTLEPELHNPDYGLYANPIR